MRSLLKFIIPGKVESVANQRLHWAVKAEQTARQRRQAMTLAPPWPPDPLVQVTITRFGVRELDGDNLSAAYKATRDGIASRLGVDDKTRLVRWVYAQQKCKRGEEHTEVLLEALP